ncbi:hypothetical protein EV363DRAFT_1177921 [Boletus edulis]|nr:hypothetical protein EV363DRAFT_1177921 [Boletus edulis]
MISTMCDIDHANEYVCNTTARAFSVIASGLGIPSLLLFLKTVRCSKKSWHVRHTGIQIIQQIATSSSASSGFGTVVNALSSICVKPYLTKLSPRSSGVLTTLLLRVRSLMS